MTTVGMVAISKFMLVLLKGFLTNSTRRFL